MRYEIGDTVVLNGHPVVLGRRETLRIDDVEHMGEEEVYISNKNSRLTFNDEHINHYATAKLQEHKSFKEMLDDEAMWEGPFEAESVSDDSLSLTVKIHGAKAYRDKLEELHRHIETVEHTIEQLNEMDMTIEIEDD